MVSCSIDPGNPLNAPVGVSENSRIPVDGSLLGALTQRALIRLSPLTTPSWRHTDRNRLLRVTGRVVTAGLHGRGCGGLDESARAPVTPGSSRCAAAAAHPYLLTPTFVWPLRFFISTGLNEIWIEASIGWWVTDTGFWKTATSLTENLKM